MRLHVVRLGRMDYLEAFTLQNTLLGLRQQDKIEDMLLLQEHPPVLTIGRSGSRENLLVPEERLLAMGVEVHDVNRGGDITYHGPGQLVGYPIVSLGSMGRDVRQFVRSLEEVFIRVLQDCHGIQAGRDPLHTGVWVGNEKITAIGLAVKRWVTQHGFAFNVNTDLNHFRWINPCGILDKGVTSLERLLGQPVEMAVVERQVSDYFGRVYPFAVEQMEKEKLFSIVGGEVDGKAGVAEGQGSQHP